LDTDPSHESLFQRFFNRFKSDGYSPQWQAVVLERLESIETLTIILILVLFVTIYSLIEVIQNQSSSIFKILDLIVSIVFISELTLRMYCYAVVNKGLMSFFSYPLNVLDVFVVSIDIVLLSIRGEIGQAESFARSVPPLHLPTDPPLTELSAQYASFESFGLHVY
jgi:hypothetical protein